MQDPLVSEFIAVTGSDESTASRLLRVHNSSLDAAVSAFFNEQAEEVNVVVETKPGPPPIPSRGGSSQKPVKPEDDEWHVMDTPR